MTTNELISLLNKAIKLLEDDNKRIKKDINDRKYLMTYNILNRKKEFQDFV